MKTLNRGVFLLLLAVASEAAFAPDSANIAPCNPQDDDACFEVVVCQNTLGCGGGVMMCAELIINGEKRYCSQAVE